MCKKKKNKQKKQTKKTQHIYVASITLMKWFSSGISFSVTEMSLLTWNKMKTHQPLEKQWSVYSNSELTLKDEVYFWIN